MSNRDMLIAAAQAACAHGAKSTLEYPAVRMHRSAWQALGEFLTGMRHTFQSKVDAWMLVCFGEEISNDKAERNHRFLEESLELVQACGCTASEAHQLVDYVFNRPAGEKGQEVGGVMVTLAALCLAQKLDMQTAGDVELARIWTKVEQIRAKQAAKPKHSPLPQHVHEDRCQICGALAPCRCDEMEGLG